MFLEYSSSAVRQCSCHRNSAVRRKTSSHLPLNNIGPLINQDQKSRHDCIHFAYMEPMIVSLLFDDKGFFEFFLAEAVGIEFKPMVCNTVPFQSLQHVLLVPNRKGNEQWEVGILVTCRGTCHQEFFAFSQMANPCGLMTMQPRTGDDSARSPARTTCWYHSAIFFGACEIPCLGMLTASFR